MGTQVTCTTIAELSDALVPHWRTGAAIGLVPTMGALHEGHLSHVRRARARDEVVVASIFVNPTQFGPSEDLARYPRTPERDAALLAAEGVDVLFMPSAEEMYPPGFATRVEVGHIGEVLEGASRPGHFAGVATVVLKLFQLVRPTRAYFGQKDAQQLAVIRQMVRDLNLPVEIIAGPTIREPDGLAMSSRNAYLNPAERRAATVLYSALTVARDRYKAGERDAEALRHVMHKTVSEEPLARLDYAEVVNADAMEAPATAEAGALLVIAARIGTTRLIDNMALD
jgi:pantoate--beta-alanine ligase